ncbi:glycoside hydrolase family 13 protein [Baudoinia panamericana UAMH 10762]|uniref:alpha-amylase n=1 Tax=Baudoinia panamericana (strain UAMH 10762) TaxID=717646 RepID=M2MVV7_BAUPA|nr:glycoside hydrolase family 13 protein [Baudoinia panamericana UAMH 10762]EMC95703.1 glycoside hydrolase family 13 protein [Baudoinia panamericana UAMH 10762]
MPAKALSLIIFASSLFQLSFAATVEEWRTRSIYQVMTDRFALSSDTFWMPCHTELGLYCGGSWKGIIDNLDYIQGMNFDAIWVSPIVAQLPQYTSDGQAYAGYWQQDLFTINTKFGGLDDIHALIAAVHARGMLFMLDVVPNHMAYNTYTGDPTNVNYTIFNPFNEKKYFHDYCPMDYSGVNSTALEECWLGSEHVPLVDLRTEDQEVQDIFGDWIEQMVANYSVDGLRIDAGANVQPDFFPGFIKRSGVFATAEVYLSNATQACEWQDAVGSMLNYPVYWPLVSAFQPGSSFSELASVMDAQKTYCQNTTAMATFSENQDVPRFANSTSDLSLAMNIATFVLMHDGIPVIYQGQEQHFSGGTNPFTNREPLWEHGFDVFAPIYQMIATLNLLRRHAMQTQPGLSTATSDLVYQDDHTMIMARGANGSQIVTVLTNSGQNASSATLTVSLGGLGYVSGTQLTEVLTCANYTVDSSGFIDLPMSEGLPRVLYPASALGNSSLCGLSGVRYNDVQQTVTATTMTATVSGSTTTMTLSVTVPLLTATLKNVQATTGPGPAGSAGVRSLGNPSLALCTALLALAASGGLLERVRLLLHEK